MTGSSMSTAIWRVAPIGTVHFSPLVILQMSSTRSADKDVKGSHDQQNQRKLHRKTRNDADRKRLLHRGTWTYGKREWE